MQTILVPVDYGDLSAAALETAVHLARSMEARVHLLYVVPDEVLTYITNVDGTTRTFVEDMAECLRLLATQYSDVVARRQVAHGDAATTIVQYARQHGCDLIAMGTHARRGVERWVMGSVAEEVLRHAPCPVLMLQPTCHKPAGEVHRLLIPVDRSDYARECLEYAVDFAAQLKAEIAVIHVVLPMPPMAPAYIAPMAGYAPVYKDLVDDARRWADELTPLLRGVRSQTIIRYGEPSEEIVALATELESDLIVMATHGRSGLSRLLMGSTTDAVVRHAPVPVLAVRADLLTVAVHP